MKGMKKFLAFSLMSLMTLSSVACGNKSTETNSDVSTPATTDSTKETSKPADKVSKDEVVNLKVFSMPSNSSGVMEGWGAEYVKEQIGVALELLPSGDQGEQKLQALMASGELPDIVVFKDNKQVVNAVAGDMLLAYDDYKDYVPNLYKYAGNALKYYADEVSDGKGKAYSVGSNVSTMIEPKGNLNWGPYLRYDLYKQLGSPEIKTSDDYLNILKQMQDLYPKNADGQKVYAFSIWKDWDNAYMFLASNLGAINGITFPGEGYLTEIDHTNNNKVSSILAEDSWYLKNLKLYFDANQMGLLDPDSMTQRFEDALDKASNGRTLFSWWGWATGTFDSQENQNNGIGFRPVMAENAKILHQGVFPIGKPWSFSVSKATKYPEKAMAFVDMVYSPEHLMTLQNGPKGVVWDVDSNNKPYILKEGYEYILDPEKELPGGNGLNKGVSFYINSLGLNGTTINSEYTVPIGRDFWDKPDYAPADTKLVDTWQEDYQAEDQIEYLNKCDGIAVAPFAPTPPLPNDIEQLTGRIGDVIKTLSWKMVFAKDQAEYDALKAEMLEKAEGMGIQKVVDWYIEEYSKGFELGQKYSK